MHEQQGGRVETSLAHGEGVVPVLVVRSSGEVGADAEVPDGDVVVVEMQRDEPSDLPDRAVLVEPAVHLWQVQGRSLFASLLLLAGCWFGEDAGAINQSAVRFCDVAGRQHSAISLSPGRKRSKTYSGREETPSGAAWHTAGGLICDCRLSGLLVRSSRRAVVCAWSVPHVTTYRAVTAGWRQDGLEVADTRRCVAVERSAVINCLKSKRAKPNDVHPNPLI